MHSQNIINMQLFNGNLIVRVHNGCLHVGMGQSQRVPDLMDSHGEEIRNVRVVVVRAVTPQLVVIEVHRAVGRGERVRDHVPRPVEWEPASEK